MELSERQEQVKADFTRQRGTWGGPWESILRFDPEFLDAYLGLSTVPAKKNHLDDKVKELVFIAVDSAATHMYLPGVRQHIQAALRLGVTPAEIMETIELASTLGIHAMNVGVPILVEVLEERGLRSGPAPLDEKRQQLKDAFIANRGYWIDFWDPILELDPEMFEAYLTFSSVPWKTGVLEPKVKELIYIAFDSAATHLYTRGTKLHIENALDHGATPEEIIEVMEIASCIGIHAATSAVPILAEEVDAAADS